MMSETPLPVNLLCHLMKCAYAKSDEHLTIIQSSEAAWVGQKVEEALPFLAGMDLTLRDLARGKISPLRMPHMYIGDLVPPFSGHVDVHIAPCPITPGLIIAIYENETAAEAIQALTQQRNELALLREQLEESNRHLKALDEERSFLIAMINHDIRAPLATIITGLSYLLEMKKNHLTEEDRRVLEMSLQAARTATNLAKRILQVERAHHMGRQEELEPIDISALLRSILNEYQQYAKKQGISVHLNGENVPTILGNWQALHEAFANIVENAIKYNVAGGKVHITFCSVEKGVLITIQDTGIGIAPEDQERVFLPFHRGKASRSQRPGTGLGLYITRQVIKQHQGFIHIESRPQQGTTIHIWLPKKPYRNTTKIPIQTRQRLGHLCQDKRPIAKESSNGYDGDGRE